MDEERGVTCEGGGGSGAGDHRAPADDDEQAVALALLEKGRVLFAQPCQFVAAAAKLEQLPAAGLPEVAFAGRSNVGKSSLVNALTGRRTLARASHTPGRTRQVNFFELGDALSLVDLPGYGYAAAAKDLIGTWTRLVDAYLTGRAPLRRVMLLIDARHGLKDLDRRVMGMLDRAAVSYQVVLTKIDKASATELARSRDGIEGVRARHTALHPMALATSARTGTGLAETRAALAGLAERRLPVAGSGADDPRG
jgi:ribosome biogenesis GTP-binding protein YsxC/EngB